MLPACESPRLSAGLPPHVSLPYPLLSVCVNAPRSDDLVAPFTIALCEDCGLITLLDYVDPDVLYRTFHSDAVGQVWEQHYAAFAALIGARYKLGAAGRLVEVGADQGKLWTCVAGAQRTTLGCACLRAFLPHPQGQPGEFWH